MLHRNGLRGRVAGIAVAALATFSSSGAAWATPVYRVLHTFQGGSDGAYPVSLTIDKAGNLYGTTSGGGGGGCDSRGCGAIFKLTPDGKETVLYAFQGGDDGFGLGTSPLSIDKAGNLYGVTYEGGASGYGTAFKLAPDGAKTILHAFAGGSDGELPLGGLLLGKKGDLYGTTNSGGAGCNCGTIFKLTKNGKEKILYRFNGGSDGSHPQADLIADGSGNLYGTTFDGGVGGFGYGDGTIFRIAPDGTHTVLYSFTDEDAGVLPNSSLIEDDARNLYGTTTTTQCRCRGGTVFKLAPDGGSISFLYTFTGGADGDDPIAILFANSAGNFYGATQAGGVQENRRPAGGTIFTLGGDGTKSTIYALRPKKDGEEITSLIKDRYGNLYGTAGQGGPSGYGTVFELAP